MDDLEFVEAPRLDVLASFFHVPDWYRHARCQDADADRFFPSKGEPGTDAVRICETCMVRQECLDYALAIERRDPEAAAGVWGDATPAERARLARLSA